jgi:hypothetical protein
VLRGIAVDPSQRNRPGRERLVTGTTGGPCLRNSSPSVRAAAGRRALRRRDRPRPPSRAGRSFWFARPCAPCFPQRYAARTGGPSAAVSCRLRRRKGRNRCRPPAEFPPGSIPDPHWPRLPPAVRAAVTRRPLTAAAHRRSGRHAPPRRSPAPTPPRRRPPRLRPSARSSAPRGPACSAPGSRDGRPRRSAGPLRGGRGRGTTGAARRAVRGPPPGERTPDRRRRHRSAAPPRRPATRPTAGPGR